MIRARIAVLASGGGSNLQAILDYFESQGNSRSVDVVLVISDREGAIALERARTSGIEALVIPHDDSAGLTSALVRSDADLVVLAGYLRKLPASVTAQFRNRILNIHPGPLPRFGGAGMYGAKVHAAVLDAGVSESAVTVHLVDEDYDHGPIVAQWPVPVLENDTPESLAQRVLEIEHLLYPRVIELVIALHTSNIIPAA